MPKASGFLLLSWHIQIINIQVNKARLSFEFQDDPTAGKFIAIGIPLDNGPLLICMGLAIPSPIQGRHNLSPR
jgi:hypothetical protein